jgi:GTP-binding protein Era
MDKHKSGFVSIVGNPNVGKSTIMNNLVGEKLSIITSKSQTTRHRIMGIVSGEDFQIVYSDTPGVLSPNSLLQESMLKYAKSALVDADVILYISDVYETIDKNIEFITFVKETNLPVILVINKVDLANQEKIETLVDTWKEIIPNAIIIPTSATENFNISVLLNKILEILPEGPAYFPKDQLTDKSERFFVSEIIREKILMNYNKEIPYSTQVEIEEFKESEKIIHINAIIYVERDTQKGIIIGHKGEALKKIGILARKDIEAFFEKQVFLGLFVKVDKDWKNKKQSLKKFGYQV